jgi:predicted dehydrogenase
MFATDRRGFLQQAAAGVAAASVVRELRGADTKSEEPLRVGLIGCGGRGVHVAALFRDHANAVITYLADCDEGRRLRAAAEFGVEQEKAVGDFRRMLDDPSVDAVIVATPDHWHAPAAIMACDADKHVYVEKPCSHNVREGRMLVEAAARSGRIVQHGTQVRSTDMMIEAVKALRNGVIGDVLVAKAWNVQRRGNIGHGEPTEPPAGLDYDTWVGPATLLPYQHNRVQGGWHWWYHFGTGDLGNDGVHDVEYARWGLGVETHPSLVSAIGGKYFFDDDQQFPDTHQLAFEYFGDGRPGSKRMLIYESRLWSTNYPRNCDSGAEFYGTKGQMFLSRRGKVQVWDEQNKLVELNIKPESQNDAKHVLNFCAAIRGEAEVNAPADVAHLTTTLCHLGNIAARLGRSFRFNPEQECAVDDPEVDALLGREYRDHWGAPRAG